MSGTGDRQAIMRVVSESQLAGVLAGIAVPPRVVNSGDFATPWHALEVLDRALAEYRLFMLNAQPGLSDRDGATLETPFVGPGMRGRRMLRYFPSQGR